MVFDHMCKFYSLIDCLERYYELLGLDDDEDIDVMIIISKVRHLCNELYEAYVIPSTSEDISFTILPSSLPNNQSNAVTNF